MIATIRGSTPLTGLLFLPLLLAACEPDLEGRGEGGAEWLSGTVDERFQQVGDQFAGFSQTMMEVGYRYEELYWAVQDANWEYAEYQAEKIGDAVERGIIRRPARAESAREHFLDSALPAFEETLATRDADAIEAGVEDLTRACNLCHAAEEMPFVVVEAPEVRGSVIRGPGGGR